MNVLIKDALKGINNFLRSKRNRRFLYLLLLGIIAFVEFMTSGLVRRTFVFYSNINGLTAVEDRLIPRSFSRELDITRYVEEVLLGPVSPDSAPLFPRETRLYSLMYREGVVYLDLTEPAVLPLPEGGDVLRNLRTLDAGIRRNFSFVKEVRLFIAGRKAFTASGTDK
jgi:hypothetical protein